MLELIKQLEYSFIQIAELLRNNDTNSLGTYIEKYNISGDDVKQADILSNIILKENLSKCSLIRSIGSEEEDEIIETEHKEAPYLICYDPLDGSSNVGVNISTGTIFGVYKYDEHGNINSGNDTVLAGYCLYSAATQYIIADSNKVSMYQLKTDSTDSSIQNFEKIIDNIKIPKKGMIYSVNECHSTKWLDGRYEKLFSKLREKNYSSRWVATLVADGHRTLLKGGIFAYPGNKSNPTGKIRLLYEAYPFAFIFEKAGGAASDGFMRLLDISYPRDKLHFKTPIIISSSYEMLMFGNIKHETV